VLPLSLSRLSGGVYGQLGLVHRDQNGAAPADQTGLSSGGGAMLQLEITTRLTLTARAGVTQAFGFTATEGALGLGIY
jgi:hypothetical protein